LPICISLGQKNMVVHSVVLVNRQCALLASRFYDGSGAAARLDWLQLLHQHFNAVIPTVRDGIQLATIRYVPCGLSTKCLLTGILGAQGQNGGIHGDQ
jgi:hypothetical protein